VRRAALLLAALLAACARGPAGPAPSEAGWLGVTHFLDSVIADGVAPGAVLAVSVNGRHYVHGTGRLGLDDPRRPDGRTLYDLASLTKVVGLTSAMMLAVRDGRLSLDSVVGEYPGDPASGTEPVPVTVRHLLTHSSGLPAWRPLYRETQSRAEAIALARSTPLDTVPGTRFAYSDLGAIWLTALVEEAYGTRIDSLLMREVFAPLGLRDTRYLPPPEWRDRIAPTEDDPWRGRVLRGEVHDENAARMDGVSGHAGLFSSAEDLLVFADWLLAAHAQDGVLAAASNGDRPALAGLAVREFTTRQDLPPGSSRALGWDTPSQPSSGGTLIGPSAFGHTGFTGTSIWIDPGRQMAIILLTNRVHPTRSNNRLGPIRGAVAERVMRAFESPGRAP
jgi:CubicO group peptidase (beta-lactamase class C family)